MSETIWTSRRAFLRSEARRWVPGRLRVSDLAVRFTAQDGTTTEVPLATLAAVRLARLPRRALVLETPTGRVHLRCFAMPAIAALLQPSVVEAFLGPAPRDAYTTEIRRRARRRCRRGPASSRRPGRRRR